MAIQKRETFAEINIKVTDEGVIGEMRTILDAYDPATGEVFGGNSHRQVVPLNDLTKVVNTPSGPMAVSDIIGSINADVAASNATLLAERNAEIAEKEAAIVERDTAIAERNAAQGKQ